MILIQLLVGSTLFIYAFSGRRLHYQVTPGPIFWDWGLKTKDHPTKIAALMAYRMIHNGSQRTGACPNPTSDACRNSYIEDSMKLLPSVWPECCPILYHKVQNKVAATSCFRYFWLLIPLSSTKATSTDDPLVELRRPDAGSNFKFLHATSVGLLR